MTRERVNFAGETQMHDIQSTKSPNGISENTQQRMTAKDLRPFERVYVRRYDKAPVERMAMRLGMIQYVKGHLINNNAEEPRP